MTRDEIYMIVKVHAIAIKMIFKHAYNFLHAKSHENECFRRYSIHYSARIVAGKSRNWIEEKVDERGKLRYERLFKDFLYEKSNELSDNIKISYVLLIAF